ncbi:MAG: Fe-S cluster assembly ATPase SufC [Vallitaleaceae bacterium]|jgi:Fe-S cluster assembly ATP-binding protein|nr:Fe-S cluster assembly ATPase SufC [Vallitaleaceae bacterium]
MGNTNENILTIEGLKTIIDEKLIIDGLNLTVNKGEIHVIMGPNGAGKSTLANALMGHPSYDNVGGKVQFMGEDLNDMKVNERAKKGLFLSFQYPEMIPGITVENFLRTAKASVTGEKQGVISFSKSLMEKMDQLGMDRAYAKRYLNQGFSGGEKKMNEILQMLILEPKLAILDETDSGLDVDAIKIVADGVNSYASDENSLVIITHYNKLLSYIEPDFVHILMDGKIVKTGGKELANQIDEEGFLLMNQ